MSWDPPAPRQGPTSAPPPPPPTATPTWAPPAWEAAAPRRSSGGRWSLLGAVVAGGGLAVGVVLLLTASGARAQAISSFARGPAGCRTVLDVGESATYRISSEVRGALSGVDGNCPAPAGPFDLGGSTAPAVEVVVRDADGRTIDLGPPRGRSYDTGSYAGAPVATVRLEPGRYEVEVTSATAGAVVAIGPDPSAVARTQRTAAAVVAAAGVASGLGAVALGRRRRR